MESVSVGWLSLVPPFVAIALALITKEVVVSLLLGVLSGTFIYSVAVGQNAILGMITNGVNIIVQKFDITTILITCLMGIIIALISEVGAQYALGEIITKKANGKKGSLLASAAASTAICISPSFHILSAGAICRPVCEKGGVSRAKLAYLLDATASPTACLFPLSTWLAAVVAVFPETKLFTNGFSAFVSAIPYNAYCILSIALVFWICFPNHDFGPMAKYEKIADETGDLGPTGDSTPAAAPAVRKGKAKDMLIPMLSFVFLTIFFMLYIGGFWGENPTFSGAIAKTSGGKAMCAAALVTLVIMFVMYTGRRIISFKEFFGCVNKGCSSMIGVCVIMVLAWGIGGVCRNLLMTTDFVASLVANSSFPVGLVPAVFFAFSCVLSFATGTSFGTFGVMMPLIFGVCEVSAPHLIYLSIASVLAGATFGDHCSPISDTTILSSAMACSDHLVHTETQLPYALTCAIASLAGFAVCGMTGSLALMWVAAIVVFATIIFVMTKCSSAIAIGSRK